MQRRTFLTSSLASAGLGAVSAGTPPAGQGSGDGKGREFYELRRYQLSSGPQKKICDDFFRDALIPAVNRLGITPVGVFNLTIGPETPAIYVLLPSAALDALVGLEARLAQDSEYLKAGAAFLNAPATEPAFVRMESSLMQAFEKMPRLVLPAATATNGPRVFELRTYESPSDQDHKRKVEMMQSGEESIFAKAGFTQVFYGDTLFGPRLPNLTYMLSYPSVADREKLWTAFATAPEWKALSSQTRYAFEAIVSNISNVIMAPAPYSQI
jgi:NIPSNAP